MERRQHPRVNVTLPVRVYLQKQSISVNAEAVDLSEGGVKLTFPEDFDLPKNLNLEFIQPTLPYRTEISGEIKWQNRLAYGVEFKKSEKQEVENIKKLLWLCEEYIERNIAYLLIKADAVKPGSSGLIREFFINNVKLYLKKISEIYVDIQNNKETEDSGYNKINHFINDILREGEKLLKKINSKILTLEIKKTFRIMTGNWIYESAYAKRGFEKPRGYPGDHILIEAIYKNKPNSEGIGTFIDRWFLNNSYAGSVRNRKDKAVDILKDYFKTCNLPEIKILNMGSGSCREIKDLLETDFTYQGKVTIACVDHDEDALSFSRYLLANIPSNVELRLLKENIINLPKEKERYRKYLGKQSLIYSLGLIDYVPDRILKNSIGFWYELLEKDGLLVITHKDIDVAPEAPYAPDWYCDWKFVTRNREHFVNLAKNAISGNYLLHEERDETGKIIFLTIKKVSN